MEDNRKIRLLSKETIDKIAAGEVVERPASVVKELVENSIDSGAKNITVEWKDGGISYIRVTDDGCGIEKSELRNAFLRHSTSKLVTVEDLSSISTLGFRGEALSSIAAVSKTEVFSKTRDIILGAHYIVEGSEEITCEDSACPDGTSVFVRQLFYNTPARRKFLKSPMTEGNYINEIVSRIALSHPKISFSLKAGGTDRFFTSGNGSLLDAIYRIEGRSVAADLIEISHRENEVGCFGFLGREPLERANRAKELFFVNKRSISSKLLSKAAEDACQGYLMLHRYPYIILFIDIDEALVDVNVHPRKAEVRFSEEERVYNAVYSAVREAIRSIEDISPIRLSGIEEASPDKVKELPLQPEREERPHSEVMPGEQEVLPEKIPVNNPEKTPEVFEEKRFTKYKERLETMEKPLSFLESEKNGQISFVSVEAKKSHRIIGQIFKTYWIVEYDNDVYLLDQHAAHEKVLYERTIKLLEKREVFSQNLNPPIVISLSPAEEDILLKYQEAFERIGFLIEPFGGAEVRLCAVPSNMFEVDPKELFMSTLSGLSETEGKALDETVLIRVATMSCKAAIKGNTIISETEARALIDELLLLDNPYHCPHGRPVMIKLSKEELDKRFNRIVNI
ncbi:MAG: DNA mismatch repair endonuclease MutL [Lachnospiraceae bacterium]|nr:DNA mismatch repair endonuclease MutL [Lachnospiraceae bacterium]